MPEEGDKNLPKDDAAVVPLVEAVHAESALGEPLVRGTPETLPPEKPAEAPKGGRWRLAISEKMLFVGTSFLTQGMRIGTTLIMARFLTELDYGFVAAVALLPSILANFGDLGVARALVQFQHDDRDGVEDTGLVISVTLGLILLLVSSASGGYFWWVRGDVNLFAVGVLSGLSMLLGLMYQFQMGCLNRDLKFRSEAMQNLIFAATTMITGAGLAMLGGGVYAVVMQPLMAQVLASIAIFPKHPLRWPRLFSWARAKKVLWFGGRITLAGWVNNLQITVSMWFLQIKWGEAVLGLVGRAKQVRDMAGQNAAEALDRMLYPLMRSGRDDMARIQQLFLRGLTGCALLVTFGCALLTVMAPELIHVVLGPRWTEVPPMLRALAPAMLYVPLLVASVAVANALGNPEVWLITSIIGLVGMVIGMAVGQMWGVKGALIGMTAGQLTWVFWSMIWAVRQTKTKWSSVFAKLGAILLAGAACFIAMAALRAQLATIGGGMWHWDPSIAGVKVWVLVLRMMAVGAVGAGVYFVVNWMLGREAIREIMAMVKVRRA